jgi:hypothetical protein
MERLAGYELIIFARWAIRWYNSSRQSETRDRGREWVVAEMVLSTGNTTAWDSCGLIQG